MSGGVDVAGRGQGGGAGGEMSGPRCILPGCSNRAEAQGMPCAQCLADFGDHLRQTDGPAMSAQAQAERDTQTQAAYAVLLAGGDPARTGLSAAGSTGSGDGPAATSAAFSSPGPTIPPRTGSCEAPAPSAQGRVVGYLSRCERGSFAASLVRGSW